jgi:hypothetical protein
VRRGRGGEEEEGEGRRVMKGRRDRDKRGSRGMNTFEIIEVSYLNFNFQLRSLLSNTASMIDGL